MHSPGNASGNLSRREGAAWLAVLPMLLYLLLTGAGSWAGVYGTQFRVVSLALLILLFVGWGIASLKNPDARPRTVLAPVILAILGAQLLAAALSPRPRFALEYVAYGLIFAGLYLLLVRLLARPALARRVAVVVAVATLIIGGAYLVVNVGLWLEWWRLIGHFDIPPTRPDYVGLVYGAPGILTAFLVCASAASISMLWPAGGRLRVLCVVLAAVVLVCVVIAAARSAWVAVAVAMAVAALVVVLTGRRPQVPASTRGRATLGAGALAVVAVGVVLAPSLLQRLASGGGEQLRVDLAANAVRLFAQHPLSGAGLGTWVTYRLPLTQPGELDWYIPHAHNAPLQTLAETGLVGAAAAIFAVFAVGLLLLRALRSGDPVRRSLVVGTVFVGVYLFVHQLFDSFMDMPAILFAAVLPVAALDAAETRLSRPPVNRRGTPWLIGIPFLLAVVPLALLVRLERPALTGDAAVTAAVLDDPARAVALSSEAITADPELTPYRWVRGLARAEEGDKQGALEDLAFVAEHDDLPQAWLNVARLEADLGNEAAARDAMRRALRIGTQQPALDVSSIPLLLELGMRDEAADAAFLAIASIPTLSDDPWWQTSPDLQALHQAAIARVVATGTPWSAWQAALLAGHTDDARTSAANLTGDQRAVAEASIDAWTGGAGERATLESMVLAEPLGPGAGWAARVAAKEGDAAAARRFQRIAALGYGSTATDPGYDVVVSDRPGIQPPGPNAGFHFGYVYHRATPVDMLVSGLPEIDLR